jgi:hypothetical protein
MMAYIVLITPFYPSRKRAPKEEVEKELMEMNT